MHQENNTINYLRVKGIQRQIKVALESVRISLRHSKYEMVAFKYFHFVQCPQTTWKSKRSVNSDLRRTSSEVAVPDCDHTCLPFPPFSKPGGKINICIQSKNLRSSQVLPGGLLLVCILINNYRQPKFPDNRIFYLVQRAFLL